jgi:hypothetical protein
MSSETGSVQRVMAELHWSETRLLDPAVRRAPEQLEALLTDDFIEFGSSGRVFTKQETMVELAAESPTKVDIADFEVRLLAAGVALVTYRSIASSGPGETAAEARRSSIWVKPDDAWQMTFHQGTRISPA